jgi:hypothetical protein|tara:strand:+ start:412 stop:543 length:132 start_codon:yes stop_codon:yes gene_type:complete
MVWHPFSIPTILTRVNKAKSLDNGDLFKTLDNSNELDYGKGFD